MLQLNLPKIIAHRGTPLDVRLTKDKQAIILHDPWLRRTTNGSGLATKLTKADISELEAGSCFSRDFIHERVPSFIEYIKQAAELNLGINIEVKATVSDAEKLAKQVSLGLKAYWPDYLLKPLISSFSSACLQAMRKEDDHFF
ncbi:glycerophosphodiester phosphodiesterase family protein [Coxiella-like endosymbiont]|uniref:glycerophosphodiester phosphodiesterase family protein n=1 Tax=Coxiella-like endosymbiont TaxID=1592897 RepID=UPI00272C1EE1|nr:glycerophosphodiester phosphodiesterase family protein [Coxiella-like endosymbiont]